MCVRHTHSIMAYLTGIDLPDRALRWSRPMSPKAIAMSLGVYPVMQILGNVAHCSPHLDVSGARSRDTPSLQRSLRD